VFDIAVIGGGISGLGIALEGSRQGLRVALLERGKLASQTSANSLRIIHGGLRYLQSLNILRAINSLKAQAELLDFAPELIKPIQCLLPLSKFGLRSKLPAAIGLGLYRALSKYSIGKSAEHRIVDSDFVSSKIPALNGCAPNGALLWTDAFVPSPEEFAQFVRLTAEKGGATIYENSPVTAIERAPDRFLVSVNSNTGPIEAKVVVNTCGPWVNTVRPESNEWFGRVGWCKAFNIVVKRQLEARYAFGLTTPDNRALFVVPRGENSAIGTWYISFKGNPDQAKPTEFELKLLLDALNSALPSAELTIGDVSAVECGVLPMLRETDKGPELFGSEQIVSNDGYVEVLSTKYTTFLPQARKVLRTVLAK
jgi:glycerol-3-phosphate dehydrogenase